MSLGRPPPLLPAVVSPYTLSLLGTRTPAHAHTSTLAPGQGSLLQAHTRLRAHMVSMTQGLPFFGKGKHRPRHPGAYLRPGALTLPVP